jgi:non-specific protein-tyrosine kinase
LERSEEGFTGIRDYIAIARARKWSIILCIALVTGAAIAASAAQTPLYTSTTRLLVEPLPADPASFNPYLPVDVQTQVELMTSATIATEVKKDVETSLSVEQLAGGVSAAPEGDTRVVSISFTSTDPQEARDVAQSFADNYVSYQRDQALQTVTDQEQAIQSRIDSTSHQLTEVSGQLADAEDAGNAALVSSLETQRNSLVARLGVQQQQLDDLQTQRTRASESGSVIEPALLPTAPSSPNYPRNTLLGLFVGGMLGAGLAFLRERLDDRFRDRADLERLIEAPVLATVPRYSPPKRGPNLVSTTETSVAAVEAYRSLRTNLQFLTAQKGVKSILVTSPSEGEGKSATTANLGVLLAQAGRRVIIVSSDLRRPTLAGYFGVVEGQDAPGLSSWLASEEETPWGIVADPGIPNLRVVPSGPLPPNPAELLNSPRVRTFVAALEANADLVLFDSPPVLAVADAAELASIVGGSVLVVNAGSTHKSATLHARQELERVGSNLLGAVLNGFDPSTSPYYYSSYSYYAPKKPTPNGDKKKNGRRLRFLSRSK